MANVTKTAQVLLVTNIATWPCAFRIIAETGQTLFGWAALLSPRKVRTYAHDTIASELAPCFFQGVLPIPPLSDSTHGAKVFYFEFITMGTIYSERAKSHEKFSIEVEALKS